MHARREWHNNRKLTHAFVHKTHTDTHSSQCKSAYPNVILPTHVGVSNRSVDHSAWLEYRYIQVQYGWEKLLIGMAGWLAWRVVLNNAKSKIIAKV